MVDTMLNHSRDRFGFYMMEEGEFSLGETLRLLENKY
jgi:hypothetical protein